MAQIFQCNYMRACLLQISKNFKHFSQSEERYEKFMDEFSDLEIEIDRFYFKKKLQALTSFLRKRKWGGKRRDEYIEQYSLDNWKKLTLAEKKCHSLYQCKACDVDKNNTSNIPKSVGHKIKKQTISELENPIELLGTSSNSSVLISSNNTTSNLTSTPTNPGLKDNIPLNVSEINKSNSTNELSNNSSSSSANLQISLFNENKSLPFQKVTANAIFNDVSKTWSEVYKTSFTNIIRKVPEINLTPRKNKVQKQKAKRALQRTIKNAIENTWKNDNRDVDSLYGTRQSGSGYMKQRSNLFLETKHAAKVRVEASKVSFLI